MKRSAKIFYSLQFNSIQSTDFPQETGAHTVKVSAALKKLPDS